MQWPIIQPCQSSHMARKQLHRYEITDKQRYEKGLHLLFHFALKDKIAETVEIGFDCKFLEDLNFDDKYQEAPLQG